MMKRKHCDLYNSLCLTSLIPSHLPFYLSGKYISKVNPSIHQLDTYLFIHLLIWQILRKCLLCGGIVIDTVKEQCAKHRNIYPDRADFLVEEGRLLE